MTDALSQHRFFAAAFLLPLWFAEAGCRGTPPGVRIELQADDEAFRPAFTQMYWMRPGRTPFEIRLPEEGEFAATADAIVGSLYIETVGALREPRAIAVRGFRDGREVSGGTLRIESSTSDKRHVRVVLHEPLPDLDKNGVPDVVDRDCLDEIERAGCMEPGTENDAGVPEAGADAGNSDRPDTAAPIDMRPPIDLAPEAPPVPTTEGLLAHWKFDDESTSRSAADATTNQNNGMLRGTEAVWAQGRAGGAIEISGTANQGVAVPASASIDSIQNAFTIAGWVYRTATRNGLSYILSRRSTGMSKVFGLALTAEGTPRILLNSQTPPANTPVTALMAVPNNAWVHVAGTFDGREVRIYINGVDVKAALVTTTVRSTGTFLCLGCGQINDTMIGEPIGGRIDDLRLYGRALTGEEIAVLAR